MGLVSTAKVGEELKFAKKKRSSNKEYVRWVHGWPCLVCNRFPVHAHHVKTRGAGGGDDQCVPLCPDHHVMSGQAIHRLGVKTFEARFGVSLSGLAAELFARFEAGAPAPYQHLLSGTNYTSS